MANKLRLLKLPPDVLDTLLREELTERHGRALLRLGDANRQREALQHVIELGLTVAMTDSYVDALLSEPEPPDEPEDEQSPSEPKRRFVMKDVRVFVNTIMHGLDLMKQGGIEAGMERQETDDCLILTISIPKNKSE